MIGFYSYTVILTYIGFVCGSVGLYFAANGSTNMAIIMLMLAGFCDMFDGKVAKTKKNRTPEECRFGIQIDSLSDMVCFGMLPPMIAFSVLSFCFSSAVRRILSSRRKKTSGSLR